MKIFYLFISAACVLLLNACTKSSPDIPPTITQINLPAHGDEIVEAENNFAAKFLNQVLHNNADNTNTFVSPLSVYLALAMVYNGADGETKDSIAKALEVEALDLNTFNETCKALIEQLPKEDNKVELNIANSIWYNQNNLQPLPPFVNTIQNNFKASIQPLVFENSSSVATINKWVNDNTHGKIKSIINSIDPNDLMYLINAVYFKGTWQYQFNKNSTVNAPFYVRGGSTVSVPFMNVSAPLSYYADSAFQMVELPYSTGEGFSMYVVMPFNSNNINEFAASSVISNWKMLSTNLFNREVNVSLPKWTSAYSVEDLRPVLSSMGMGIAFGDNANLSKMYNSAVKVTKAVHKAYINVYEEGTEAAAVTSVDVGVTSVGPVSLKIDHPFVYVIAEKQTGTILFTGVMYDPSKS